MYVISLSHSPNPKHSYILMRSLLLLLLLLVWSANSLDTGLCTITLDDKVFTLRFLQSSTYYSNITSHGNILFNFCHPFEAPDNYSCPDSFSMIIDPLTKTCQTYSSDSITYLYSTALYEQDDDTGVVVSLNSGIKVPTNENMNYTTSLIVKCGSGQGYQVQNIQINDNGATLVITGTSQYGCPVLELNRFWEALDDNQLMLGIIMFAAGVLQLFLGRKLLAVTIFITTYCLSFVVLGALVSEIFLSPYSSAPAVYMCLLLILVLSSVIAYLSMGFSYVSIFLVGAYMGFIVALLLNSLLVKMFDLASTWPLIVMSVLFCLVFGFLTYKMHDQLIIISTSLTGAYMVVRPISWIFGGFPNEMLINQMIRVKQITTLPGSFFLYLLLILILAGVGATYQFIKLKRQNADGLEVSRVQETIQNSVDSIRNSINQIIDKYKRQSDEGPESNYIEFNDMRKVPLYPDLNEDRVSKSEEIKQNLLKNIQQSNGNQRLSKDQAPQSIRALRELSSHSEQADPSSVWGQKRPYNSQLYNTTPDAKTRNQRGDNGDGKSA